jgi:hypothetical protein
MNMHTTIELLFETVFSAWCVQSDYKEDSWGKPVSLKSSCEEKTVCCSYSIQIRCQDVTNEAGKDLLFIIGGVGRSP